MFCVKCGKEVNDNVKFCSGCGAAMEGVPPQPGQYVQPTQQPGQYAQPGYQQPQQQYSQYTTPQQPAYQQQPGQYAQPQKKSKKPLFGIAGAAAAVLVFMLVIFPVLKGGDGGGNLIDTGDDTLDIEIYVDKPGGRDLPFEPTEGGFTTNDQSIGMIEVNQGMSYGFDTDTGEFYLMDNFVAGKETAVFVSLSEPPDPKSEITLTVKRDGEPVGTLFPEKTDDPALLLFQPRDMSDMGNWAMGAYTFTLTIDDKYAERTTNFFEAMPIKVLAVPVISNNSGVIRSCNGTWMNSSKMLYETYPVAKENLEYVLGPELDLSDPKYDLDTERGMYRTWDAIGKLQTPGGDYTLIVGFIPDDANNGRYRGYTYGLPASIVSEADKDMLSVVLHEIAHCFKIGDEYKDGCINNILNAPPYKMPGRDIITGQQDAGNKEKVIGGESLGLIECGSIIYPEQRAYCVEDRMLLETTTSFMGWVTQCDPYEKWVTSDIWNHLFRVFTGQMVGNEPGFAQQEELFGQCYECFGYIYTPLEIYIRCPSCGVPSERGGNLYDCPECGEEVDVYSATDSDFYIECQVCSELLLYDDFVAFNSGTGQISASASYDNLITVVEITGYFEPGGTFVPSPWYSYPAPIGFCTVNKSGEYSVIVLSDKGETLSVTYFDVVDNSQGTSVQGAAPMDGALVPINVVCGFPENTAKIVIKKGTQEVFTREVSRSAPKVAFTGLDDYTDLPNKTTITWEASDADGDELTFQLWYCLSQEEYYLVDGEISGTSLEVNMSDYPGAEGGYFYIYATDGIRTAEASSPYVNMPFKAPVIITEQTSIPKIKVTDEIFYPIEIYDAQDGWLSGESVSWMLYGEEVSITCVLQSWPYMLEPGRHTYTCIATNSAGLSTEKEFTFDIIDDESDLPDDWSREPIVHALTEGYTIPTVRIDSPITRSEYATLMFMLFYWANPEGLVYYDENLIKDCGPYDYYQFLMVALGVMEAPDGYFEPNKSLTGQEALRIMYQIYMLATNPGTTVEDFVYDENEAKEFFIEIGVISESGENSYQPDVRLSKKLALARSGLLDMWLFYDEEE